MKTWTHSEKGSVASFFPVYPSPYLGYEAHTLLLTALPKMESTVQGSHWDTSGTWPTETNTRERNDCGLCKLQCQGLPRLEGDTGHN